MSNTGPKSRSLLAASGWVVGLGGCLAALWTMPVGPAPSTLSSSFDPGHWASSTEPIEMAATLVRYSALAWVIWLCLLTAGALLLSAAGAPHAAAGLISRLPAIGSLALRPLAGAAVAASLTVGSIVPAGAQAGPTSTAEPDVAASTATPTATITHIGDVGWPAYEYPVVPSDLAEAADSQTADEYVSSPSQATDEHSSWKVEQGDNLWSIAERTAPEGSDLNSVAKHWLAIIETNRNQLPQPDNPDLILPGMLIEIPKTG